MQLVDAGMVAFPAWHALQGKVDQPLTYQVPRMLRSTLRDVDDTFVLFWNAERLEKREMWPDYRDRPEIGEEAGAEDFAQTLELLSALGCPQVRAEGLEADEALAAYAHRLGGDEEVVIRSDDKDLMQLLGPSTRMDGRRRGRVEAADVEEILGVPPALVSGLLALAGDEADGIPGILTPVPARELLARAGPVEDWIDDGPPERVDPDVRETVQEARDQLRLNLRLVDLSEAAVGEPPPPDWTGWADPERARASASGPESAT